jgi:hypothetical protein
MQQAVGSSEEDPWLDFACPIRDSCKWAICPLDEEDSVPGARDQASKLMSDARGLVPTGVCHHHEITRCTHDGNVISGIHLIMSRMLFSAAIAIILASLQSAVQSVEPKPSPAAPVVLYDEALNLDTLERVVRAGGKRYLIVYQDDCDKGARQTGTIDTASLSRHVAERAGGFPSDWAVLDYETPFDDWIREGPGSPRWKIATDAMVAAIERMKALFPDVKWTYYGVPRLEYYLDGKTWVNADESARKAEIERQFERYAPIIAKCDWLAPSVYMVVGDRNDGGRAGPLQRRETRAWTSVLVGSSVEFAKRLGRSIPVIPFVSPVYQPGGGSRNQSFITPAILDECTIEPIVAAGGSGVCIWTAGAYMVSKITAAPRAGDEPDPEAKAVVRNWSEDLQLPESFIRSPDGVAELRNRYASATASFAEQFAKVWSIRNAGRSPAESTAPAVPAAPATPGTSVAPAAPPK